MKIYTNNVLSVLNQNLISVSPPKGKSYFTIKNESFSYIKEKESWQGSGKRRKAYLK